jgi:hypothetical protein
MRFAYHVSPCCLVVFCILFSTFLLLCILFCNTTTEGVVVILTFVRHTKKRGKRRGRYVPSYRFCTTQILTWGPIADRRLPRLGRSVRSDRPSRSGPSTSVSVYNHSHFRNSTNIHVSLTPLFPVQHANYLYMYVQL